MAEKHTICCIVENHFGVLARISGLISARAFNIDSLTVSATEDPSVSHMTIVVDADAVKLEQVKRQLGRLVDVIEVKELKEKNFIGRDLILVRVKADGAHRDELESIVKEHGARISEEDESRVIIEAVGRSKTIDTLVERLRPYGIINLVRAGRVAMER